MTIAIDLTSLSYHITGIERYAVCLSEQILEQDKNNQYYLIFRNNVYMTFDKYIDNKRIKSIVINGNNKVLFYQVILPWNLNRIKAEKYMFFAFTSPILFRKKGIYNTIHDMGAWDSPKSMRFLQRVYWRTTMRFSVKSSERIITVSEFSKNRVADILHYPRNRIFVINSAVYECVTKDYGYSFNNIKEEYSLPNKYIMTLSTLEPRKNMTLLLDAFTDIQDKVDYDLVLVGRKGWKMDEVIEKYNKSDRIHITGFVKDEHLSVIYRNAICFVFPSLYEGFGLPPVEALSLGTPVISSDAASMPEVLRNQAVFFKNGNIDDLSKLLLNLEKRVESMPHELDDYQKRNYRFSVSAYNVLKILNS